VESDSYRGITYTVSGDGSFVTGTSALFFSITVNTATCKAAAFLRYGTSGEFKDYLRGLTSDGIIYDGEHNNFFLAPCNVGLDAFVPFSLSSSQRFFRFSLIFPALTLVADSPFLVSRNLFVQLLVVPLHLFGMFRLLHALYSVSKSLLVAEKGQVATFGECAPTFVLLIASIVGVWFIQPRVNRLYAQR
jgi:hypothetical protein